MDIKEAFLEYANENYKDIAFSRKNNSIFPDVETGYTLVKIVYNKAYHTLDMRFSGMGDYESIFGSYVYPILMKYRDFSIWKMASARVIRVKVPCMSEEVGFIPEDCREQMERVRTLMEILSQIDVSAMYIEQRKKREALMKEEAVILAETDAFLKDYQDMLESRGIEKENVGKDSYGQKGLLYRLSSMNKDIVAFISSHTEFITTHKNSTQVILLMNYKERTEDLIKEIM